MVKDSDTTHFGTATSRWAGVGPYYAMFPVSFAQDSIRKHTRRGDSVLDPFAGRATSVFAAACEERIGVGIEINPVGWVYGKAKIQTASRESVEERIRWLGRRAKSYREQAWRLPTFFRLCFSAEIRAFLLAARDLLEWRRSKTDWTAMALLLVDLHGKREAALSNQMRQTKSMSPQYAIDWWNDRELAPPERDPVEFMLKKIKWRYAKGMPEVTSGRMYLGNCQEVLARLGDDRLNRKAKLLLTSPPYFGVTNYFYDQWLRLWLLGGPTMPRSPGDACMRKFQNKRQYVSMLLDVFEKSSALLTRNAVVHVRTDARDFTREATIEALELAFPKKRLRKQTHSLPETTQTNLFAPDSKPEGEMDFVMW